MNPDAEKTSRTLAWSLLRDQAEELAQMVEDRPQWGEATADTKDLLFRIDRGYQTTVSWRLKELLRFFADNEEADQEWNEGVAEMVPNAEMKAAEICRRMLEQVERLSR